VLAFRSETDAALEEAVERAWVHWQLPRLRRIGFAKSRSGKNRAAQKSPYPKIALLK
jgi:hypothetical protein